jgi:tripartite-type tricarboxylate transporter receptor subunit TctC
MLKSLGAFFTALAALAVAPAALAQEAAMPALVRLVVPFAAGAGTDVVARVMQGPLAARLGTNVIIDNRPGASGLSGAGAVAKGPADGSMLLLTSVSLMTTAATKPNMPFDVSTALVPVALLGQGPMLIAVSATSDIETPADLVAAARAKSDALTHGTAGIGTIAHMAAELLNDAAGIQIRHIPYRGAAPAVIDLASGNLDVMIAANSTLAAQIKAGRVRPIAVTSNQPSPSFPGLPPMASAAPGYSADLWQAVFVPTGTPPALVQRLNREINEVMKTREMHDLLQSDGFVAVALAPDEVRKRVRESFATWKKLATAKKIVAE